MSPKPTVPKIIHVDDPELHISHIKTLEDRKVDPPITRPPAVRRDEDLNNSVSSFQHLEPPQSPEGECEDFVNICQHVNTLAEIYVVNINHVDLLRNVNHQLMENNL